MDTKLITQFGTDILCYRIRTARQKKRMQYEDFDKHLIALSKEEDILYRSKYKPEWEPLSPPVQRGWKRFFVLRDDVARSKQATFFEDILKKINTEAWSYGKDFKIKKRRFGRKIYMVKGQELRKPDEQEFKKLNFTEAEKQVFHAEYHYDQWERKFMRRFVFNEPWRFVLRTRPKMIDRKIKIDSEKKARSDEIRNYLERNDHRKRIGRILTGHYQHKTWGKPQTKDAFKNRSFNAAMDFINEEQFYF